MITINTIVPTAAGVRRTKIAELRIKGGIVVPKWYGEGIRSQLENGIVIGRDKVVTFDDGQKFIDALRREYAMSSTIELVEDGA